MESASVIHVSSNLGVDIVIGFKKENLMVFGAKFNSLKGVESIKWTTPWGFNLLMKNH